MHSSSEKERFIGILRSNKGILYKVINSYCKDPEDKKDLEQEIIVQLWKSLKSYNETYKMSTWIYRIALNVSISFYRRDVKRQKSRTSVDESIFQIANNTSSEEIKSETELLYKFIDRLDEFNKAIMILYLEDKSYKEIAEIIGITESNVGTKISRIKGILKESFSTINQGAKWN